MLGHQHKKSEKARCRVCGKESEKPEAFHYITGFGYVCRDCGIQQVVCDSCGSQVRRMTVTVLRGKTLCLVCYRTEREKGDKRLMKELVAESIDDAVKMSMSNTPEGYVLVGLRLKHSSKQTWTAEYEREDIYLSRCS
ncbi:MAG: hypothetical protein NZ956_02035 [Candidatus Caldarchaeum sp.]|nr:hypothetical protein [Candidatus Caldarchaeum sp.]